jgi:hypothetical protein
VNVADGAGVVVVVGATVVVGFGGGWQSFDTKCSVCIEEKTMEHWLIGLLVMVDMPLHVRVAYALTHSASVPHTA